jgi:hypothetical protein
MNDIQRLTERIREFRDERDWLQFHTAKDILKPATTTPGFSDLVFKEREAGELTVLGVWVAIIG